MTKLVFTQFSVVWGQMDIPCPINKWLPIIHKIASLIVACSNYVLQEAKKVYV